MKRVFAVHVLLVVAVAAVGFYRGWFSVAWEKDTGDGKGQVPQMSHHRGVTI